jgi:hypothetical protein
VSGSRRVALPETPVGQGRFPWGYGLSPGRASGKMVRGRCESGPDPQELLRDTDNDGTSDDELVSSYRTGGFQDQAGLVSLVLSWQAFLAFVAGGSR